MKTDELVTDNEIKLILEQANMGIPEVRKIIHRTPGERNVIFELAADTSCSLCGRLPCGESTSMALATSRAGGKIIFVAGVCDECKPSTTGQSELRVHYRAYLQKDNHSEIRVYVIRDGKEAEPLVTSFPNKKKRESMALSPNTDTVRDSLPENRIPDNLGSKMLGDDFTRLQEQRLRQIEEQYQNSSRAIKQYTSESTPSSPRDAALWAEYIHNIRQHFQNFTATALYLKSAGLPKMDQRLAEIEIEFDGFANAVKNKLSNK